MAEQGAGSARRVGWLSVPGVGLRVVLLVVLASLAVVALASGGWLNLCVAIGLSGSVAYDAGDRVAAADPTVTAPWRRVRALINIVTWCAIAAAAVLFVRGLFAG